MTLRWIPPGHDRVKSENFVLAANIALRSPTLASDENTEPTGWPAAACTVRGTNRSSFQVTPCPPAVLSTRRLVTMPVWLGSVRVSSTSLRALSVKAPSCISRWNVGVPASPSRSIASGLSPSTEIATTRVMSAARRSTGGEAVAGAEPRTTATRAAPSAVRRRGMAEGYGGR